MDSQAKVSVIVPVFNAGEKLVPSIESLLNQTLKDIEIIIVNDASTDDSGSVIDQLAKENANIVPVHFPENKGVHEARLAGLKKSTAPWIGFLDADDFAEKNMFEKMCRAAEREKVDIVVCGWRRVKQGRKFATPRLRLSTNRRVDSEIFEQFCRMEFGGVALWNKLYKRDLIAQYKNLYFPWRQSINEDLILNIGCFLSSGSIYCLRDVLYNYYYNPASVTSKIDNVKAYVETYRAFALAVHCYSHFGSDQIRKIAELYRHQLSSGCYVDHLSELDSDDEGLCEAIRLICEEDPALLAKVNARKLPVRVSAKLALRSLAYRVQSIFVNRS